MQVQMNLLSAPTNNPIIAATTQRIWPLITSVIMVRFMWQV